VPLFRFVLFVSQACVFVFVFVWLNLSGNLADVALLSAARKTKQPIKQTRQTQNREQTNTRSTHAHQQESPL
jgi:hypothetical protein